MAGDSTQQPDQHTYNWEDDAHLSADKHVEGRRREHRESTSSCSTTADTLSPKATSMQGDAHVYIPSHGSPSIYGLYSPRRRNTILLAAAFTSILVPFCDTIYLPALAVGCCYAVKRCCRLHTAFTLHQGLVACQTAPLQQQQQVDSLLGLGPGAGL